jgi:superfamily II DNA or RNA helicase
MNMPVTLHPYQIEKVEEVFRLITEGQRRILVVSPTGSGKTVIAAEIIRRLNIQRQHVLFLDHLREITGQTSRKLNDFGVFNGILQAGIAATPLAGVQVASIQTLFARAIKGKRLELPPAKVIFVDEAHHVVARSYLALLEAYPDAIIIGLTATPCRGDGRGLGGVFDVMMLCPSVPELIDLGFLVPCRVFGALAPDLAGVKTSRGDYAPEQLARRVDQPKLIADIVTTWFKRSENRQTVYYATSRGHSVHIRDEFLNAGITCEHVDGDTPIPEREDALKRFAAGDVRILTNVGVFTEGWDVPDIGVVGLARPTKSYGLLTQMIGRGRRIAPGKTYCTVLDHGGHFPRMGMPDDAIDWTLDPDNGAARNRTHAKRTKSGSRISECSQCGALREGGKPCPSCGFLPMARPDIVIPREGELVEISQRRKEIAAATAEREVKRQWHAMLLGYARERGWNTGAAAHRFREKFGHWPPHGRVEPIEPSPEVRSWVRSRSIAWAKSQQREDAAR